MKGRCTWACNSGPVTFGVGTMTLTLTFCVSAGGGSIHCSALVELVSFLISSEMLCVENNSGLRVAQNNPFFQNVQTMQFHGQFTLCQSYV